MIQKGYLCMKRLLLSLLTVIIILGCCSCAQDGKGTVDLSAPSGMKLASDKAADFKFYVPDSWIIDTASGTPCAYASEIDPSNITAVRVSTQAPNAEEYWKTYVDDFKTSFKNFTLITEGEKTTLSGVDAKKYVYTAELTGVMYKYCTVICISSGSAYIVTYTAQSDYYENNQEAFISVCNNFMIKTNAVE